jgi:hypothetical protein
MSNLFDKKQSTEIEINEYEKEKLIGSVRKKYTNLMRETFKFKKNKMKSFLIVLSRLNSTILIKIISTIYQVMISVIAVILYITSSSSDVKYYDIFGLLNKELASTKKE